MKRFYLILLSLFNIIALTAQERDYNFNWVNAYSPSITASVQINRGYSIQTDECGNVYTSGTFQGTVDFDLSSDDEIHTYGGLQESFFTTKTDALGNHIWTKSVQAPFRARALDMVLDINNNVINVGDFYILSSMPNPEIDFDPGPGEALRTLEGSTFLRKGGYIQKLDEDGNFEWVAILGENGSGTEAHSVSSDNRGNIYVTGQTGGGDFDPGNSEFILEGGAFVVKLSAQGELDWAYNIASPIGAIVKSRGIDVDSDGNVAISGFISSSSPTEIDYGNGITTTTIKGFDVFVVKLNNLGNPLWARMFGDTDSEYSFDLAVDSNGNIYHSGAFRQTVDLDPTATTDERTSNGGFDFFIQKLDKDGNYEWSRTFGNSSGRDTAQGMAIDHEDNVHVTGHVSSGTINFPTPTGEKTVTTAGQDVIILKLDSEGNYIDVHSIIANESGGNYEWGAGISTDTYGNVYATGSGPHLGGANYGDGILKTGSIYVLKLSKEDEIIALNGEQCKPIGEDFDPVEFSITQNVPFDTFSWDFGDPESEEENTSNLETPVHTYTKEGTYTVELTASYGCHPPIKIIYENVNIYYTPVLEFPSVFNECTSSIILNAENEDQGATYLWSTGETTQFITVENSESSQNISVTITKGETCEITRSTLINFVPVAIPTIRILASSSLICPGEETIFSVQQQSSEGDSPSYNWQINGEDVPNENNLSFTSSSINDGDIISIQLTSSATCANPALVLSNEIEMTVSTNITPLVTITSSSEETCNGSEYCILIEDSQGGGTTPEYQWFVNDIEVAETGTSFCSLDLKQDDNVYVRLTSSSECANVPSNLSNNHIVSFKSINTPTVAIETTTPTQINAGENVCFAISEITFEGQSPTFQWYLNGNPISGENNTGFCSNTLEKDDLISVQLTSSDTCLVTDSATSNSIIITGNSLKDIIVSIDSIDEINCENTEFCLEAIINIDFTNEDSLNYKWYINGNLETTNINSATFCSTDLYIDDSITVQVSCETCNASTSEPYQINIPETPIVDAGTDLTITEGEEVILNVTTSENGGTYEWVNDNNNEFLNGKSQIVKPNETTTYTIVFTNDDGCTAEDQITVFVEPLPEDQTKYGFSPDNDGINDIWEIDRIEEYLDNKVQIFNRWGDLVFETKGYNNESNFFNGRANKLTSFGAGELSEGTYFFKIYINGEHHLKKTEGYLILKR